MKALGANRMVTISASSGIINEITKAQNRQAVLSFLSGINSSPIQSAYNSRRP